MSSADSRPLESSSATGSAPGAPTLAAAAKQRVRDLVGVTKQFAREHRGRSWFHLWSTLGVMSCAFLATALPFPWLVRAGFSVLAALLLVRMFVIYHDHSHRTILRGSRLAKVIMYGFGVLTLNPPSAWKSSHDYHHKHNAKNFGVNIGSFPLLTTHGYARASRWERFAYALSRHPLTIACAYLTVFLYSMSLKPLIMERASRRDCGIAVALHLGIITLLAVLAPYVLLFTFMVPMWIASALGAYLFYSQHNFPGVQLRDRPAWDFVFAALYSSSYTAMGPVMQWFTGNIGYHHVHHLNAHIPFYRLPEAMRAIRELQTPSTIRLTVSDVCRCFRLKLWDPEKGMMVSFDGT